MTDMAREGAPIPVGKVDKRPSRSNIGRNAAVAAVILAAVAGGGFALSQRGGGPSQETPPPTPIGTVIPTSEVPPTAPVTIPPTERPSPSPTEKVLTNAEKIEMARKAQKEAESQGLFKVPIPQVILGNGGDVNQGAVLPGGERDLHFTVKKDEEISFPSLVDATVMQAKKIDADASYISLQYGDRIVNIIFPSNAALKVKLGDKVSIGTALFIIKYESTNPIQKSFENSGAEKLTPGTIAVLAMREGTGFFKALSSDNLLRDQNNKPITIPTLN